MVALLDVNVLIALLDGSHLHHAAATQWLADNLKAGWASCPLTQNGCIRILSQSAYPNCTPAAKVAAHLAEATQRPEHHFWPDSVSLLTPGLMDWHKLLTGRYITDAYLLALAVKNHGRFVTLDRGIPLQAVKNARDGHLVVIETSTP